MAKTYTQNRELSWLKFNKRVLEESEKKALPLFEKLNFISIFSSNLDEFFMIRVGSLHDIAELNSDYKDNKTGMSAQDQIDAISQMLRPIYAEKDSLFDKICVELKDNGIFHLKYEELADEEKLYLKKYFAKNLLMLTSPQIIDKSHPFPFLENLKLYIFIEFAPTPADKRKYGLIPVRDDFQKFIRLPSDNHNIRFVMIEDLLLNLTNEVFKDSKIENKYVISITRNFDLTDTDEIRDEFDDYKSFMKTILKRRQRLAAVRLESNQALSNHAISFLSKSLNIDEKHFFTLTSPINMSYVSNLKKLIDTKTFPGLFYNDFSSYNPAPKETTKSYIELVENHDLLLSYPYDDIQAFLSFIKEASTDENVISIKITIYRLAKNSKLVKYLSNASENGKEVTVFMELKARFDEENNINYSDMLYDAGCNIIYGFEDYKIHSKICLVTYKKDNKIKYITQIGTGNYNESTAKQYTDFSFITANEEIGKDAGMFFYNMSIGKINGEYVHLLQSPSTFKKTMLRFMDEEIKKGSDGRILIKMNSFTDYDFMKKIAFAGQSGVKVNMIIRGITCLIPGIKGKTENVHIESVVGRFLEHSRVYIFSKGEDMKVYISSADLMTRNTEKRVEIACPIYDKTLKKFLENYLLTQLKDTIGGRFINESGDMQKKDGEPFSSQEYFMQQSNIKKNLQKEQLLAKSFKKTQKNKLAPESDNMAPKRVKNDFFSKLKKLFKL